MNKVVWIAGLLVLALLSFRLSAKAGAAPVAVWEIIAGGALVIDVRTAEEFASGHLDEAINITYDQTDSLVKAIGEDKTKAVVLYCRSGRRSAIALEALAQRGYTNIVNGGGFATLRDTRPAATTQPVDQHE